MHNHPNIYPNSPGHRGVDTSIAAAADMANSLGYLQRRAFTTIRASGNYGLTADELAMHLAMDRYSIQPRTSELKRKGLIADSRKRRRNATGKLAIVWVVTEKGANA